MTAAEVLTLAKAHCVTIRLDGDGLELIADRKPDADLLGAIAGRKAEIVALLRRLEVDYGLVFRERIRGLGDDGLKEEPRLRTLEAVVNLFRANNPGASIDEAAAAVTAAINSMQEKTTP